MNVDATTPMIRKIVFTRYESLMNERLVYLIRTNKDERNHQSVHRRAQTFARSSGSRANLPSFVTVHVELPGFSTPLDTMHKCAARAATMTPTPPVSAFTSSATSLVRRSCTCKRLECRLTMACRTSRDRGVDDAEAEQYATLTVP